MGVDMLLLDAKVFMFFKSMTIVVLEFSDI